MSKGYWIIHVNVTDPEGYPEYVQKDTPIIEGLGGRFIVRGGTAETREGESLPRHVVVEFPSYSGAIAAYEDMGYQNVADIRRRCAESSFIIVEGV